MTNALIILAFWVVVILGVRALLRSRFFRDACEDIRAMYDAPENSNKARDFEAYMAHPVHQAIADREKAKRETP